MTRVTVIGGGLAGCSAAYILKRAGYEPVIYEAESQLASKASGNKIGLYNPRFGAEWSAQSQYYAAVFARALGVFAEFDDVDFNPCGALHLMMDEKKERRFTKMCESWDNSVEMALLSAQEASDIAGVEVAYDALYLPQSGSVCPEKLCEAYARGVEVVCNSEIDVDDIDADFVILATGISSADNKYTNRIGLNKVRGQVTLVEGDVPLKTNICYSGYISAPVDGQYMVGSTFQRWLDHSDILPEDDVDNLNKLYAAIPSVRDRFKVVGHRASVRTTSRDHFPVVGQLSEKLYLSTAHGSHGILSSLMAAEILVSMIGNKPQALSDDVIKALSPQRFVD